jgi:hypothetical protein
MMKIKVFKMEDIRMPALVIVGKALIWFGATVAAAKTIGYLITGDSTFLH